MQAKGRLYSSICNYKNRLIQYIDGNIITLDTTSNIITDGVYKPFIIQGTYVTRIISVIDTTRVEVDDSSGFSIGYCYTPWSNRWVLKTGDKVSRISDGDILVGLGGDLFQIVCHHNHGVKTSILGLWPLGSSPEPTSCDTLIFTPTSKFHLLPNSSPDVDITNLL